MEIPRCFQLFLANTDQGVRPTQPLLELFKLLEIEHDGTIDDPEDGMVKKASEWQTGQLQCHIEEQHGDIKESAKSIFRQFGLVDERRLTDEDCRKIVDSGLPTEILVAGARFRGIRKRSYFAAEESRKLLHFTIHWVALGSIRGLDDDEIEAWEKLTEDQGVKGDPPFIEADLAFDIVQKVSASKGVWVNPERVCAPPRKKPPKDAPPEEHIRYRAEPGFADTLDAWLKLRQRKGNPVCPCNAIVAASGPAFDRYAWDAMQKLPSGSNVFVIGYETLAGFKGSQYLNEVALMLQQCAAWLKSLDS